jgi:hypothetical protein
MYEAMCIEYIGGTTQLAVGWGLTYREHSVPVDFPDAEQFMHAIEQVINKVGYPEKDIEDYIVAWADEIKNSK